MHFRLLKRLLETDKRLLWKLFWTLGVKGLRAIQKHKRRLRNFKIRRNAILSVNLNARNSSSRKRSLKNHWGGRKPSLKKILKQLIRIDS